MSAFAKNNHSIELFALSLMDGHHLNTWRVVDAAENLISRQSLVKSGARVCVLSVANPRSTKSRTDVPAPIESDQVVQILSRSNEVLIT
jgi:hypothetical protein